MLIDAGGRLWSIHDVTKDLGAGHTVPDDYWPCFEDRLLSLWRLDPAKGMQMIYATGMAAHRGYTWVCPD